MFSRKAKAVLCVYLTIQLLVVCLYNWNPRFGAYFRSDADGGALLRPNIAPVDRKQQQLTVTRPPTSAFRLKIALVEPKQQPETVKRPITSAFRPKTAPVEREQQPLMRRPTPASHGSPVVEDEPPIDRLRRLEPLLITADIGPDSDSDCLISNVKPPNLGRSDITWKCDFSPTFVHQDRIKRTLNVTCKGTFKVSFVNREESDVPRSDNNKYMADPVWKEHTGPKVLPFESKYADVVCKGKHNYRTQLKPDKEVEAKQRLIYDKTVKDGSQPLSILAISIDSMSRANFYRPYGLPRTAALIKRLFYAGEEGGDAGDKRPSHRAFLFNRFNSINRFTAMNLVPRYSGEPLTREDDRLRVRYLRMMKKVHEWEWDYAASRGYITSYAVDTRNGLFGTRSVCKTCSYRPGALPHFEQGWDSKANTVLGNGVLSGFCEGDSLLFDYIRNYTLQFLRRDYPAKWAAFDTNAHHRSIAESGNQIDATLVTFLETAMKENPNLAIFLFGDHGKPYGRYPGHVGSHYESFMPFFSIILPQYVIQKRPEFADNLLNNSQRLISQFDIHKTAKSLMHYPNVEKVGGYFAPHAVNLLTNTLSPSRTCSQAGVPDFVCVCNRVTKLSEDKWPREAKQAVDKAVTYINQRHTTQEIAKSGIPTSCQDVKFKKISSVSVSQNRQKMDSHSLIMEIIFDLVQGPASFKLIANKDLEIHSLKQLTLYKKYSVCLDKRVSIEFCICKNFPAGTP